MPTPYIPPNKNTLYVKPPGTDIDILTMALPRVGYQGIFMYVLQQGFSWAIIRVPPCTNMVSCVRPLFACLDTHLYLHGSTKNDWELACLYCRVHTPPVDSLEKLGPSAHQPHASLALCALERRGLERHTYELWVLFFRPKQPRLASRSCRLPSIETPQPQRRCGAWTCRS